MDLDRERDLERLRRELARLPDRLRLRDPLLDRERDFDLDLDFERLPLRLRRELARLPERLRLLEPLLDLDRERDLERFRLARLPDRLRDPLLDRERDFDFDLDFERLPLRRELARLPLRLLEPLFERERDFDRDLERLPLRLREPDFERAFDADLDRLRERDATEPAFEPDLDLLRDFFDRFEPTLRLRLFRDAGDPLRDRASPFFFTGLDSGVLERLFSLDSTLSAVVFCWDLGSPSGDASRDTD